MSIAQFIFNDLLFKLLVLLNLMQMIIGFGTLISEEYFKYLLRNHMLQSELTQTYIIMLLAQIFSIQILVIYYFGFSVAYKCNYDVYTPHLVFFIKLWLMLGFVSAVEGLLLAFMFHRMSSNLSEFLELELFKGVEAYYLDPEWRLIWDNIQYHEKCCGVFDYHDWKNCWLYRIEHKEKRVLTSNVSFIPYSCCENETNCYHNIIPILLKDQEITVPTIDKSVINVQGCIHNLLSECKSNITGVIIANVIAFFIQILIILLLRCLYLSKRVFDTDFDENVDEKLTLLEDQVTSKCEKNITYYNKSKTNSAIFCDTDYPHRE